MIKYNFLAICVIFNTHKEIKVFDLKQLLSEYQFIVYGNYLFLKEHTLL